MKNIDHNSTKEDCLKAIDDALTAWSCDFVDWEELHFNSAYRPEFPKKLTNAMEAVRHLKRLDKQV